ncbi:MAG TPA: hypothetical protein VH054_20155 [Polyangiaceae bacterium]|jgi:hypothetical protein|nr:hypothetical protein [Polyangiaceae bacterium]
MRALFLLSVCVACGSSQPVATAPTPTCPVASSSTPPVVASSASSSPSATATATTSAPPPPREPPPELVTALDGATKAIASRDWPAADKQLATATTAAADDAHLAYLVARVRAVRWASVNDFEKAASAFVAVIPSLAKRPELKDEFWAHNAMMMIREAQGDPAAALAENDQATLAAARGTWDAGPGSGGRETLAFQKDRWHRAYLTRMLAESRTGSAKQALVAYAESALTDYRTRGFGDSVAILEAYFAALDGKKDAALAAAKRVDAAKDDDVEDLYLVVVGLDAGGDRAGADAVRKIMRASTGVHIARSIMLHWLDLDAKGAGFTPRHANAR